MSEDRNRNDNVEIEPLSDDELEDVAGGATATSDTSTGPSCCSCTSCSPRPTSGYAYPTEPTIGRTDPGTAVAAG